MIPNFSQGSEDVFEWKGQGHGLPLPIREDEESGR